MTKENFNIATIKELAERLEKLNKRMKKDPLLFYGDVGKEAILLTKELHIQGSMLIKTAKTTENSMKILKKIPLRK